MGNTKQLGRSIPIRDAFTLLGVSSVTGYALIAKGEIKTYLVGSRRYTWEREVDRFRLARIAEARTESAAERAAKVKAPIAGRAKQRARAAA